MNTTFWHWPDHCIGKRESRRLREEHNAAMNRLAQFEDTDPAAEFAAALSVKLEVERLLNDSNGSLSDTYLGCDEFMRICMKVGRGFEIWCCTHIDFDKMIDVWPYLLEDKFGKHAVAVAGGPGELGLLIGPSEIAYWVEIARRMELPRNGNANHP